jgi:hypothetical protein
VVPVQGGSNSRRQGGGGGSSGAGAGAGAGGGAECFSAITVEVGPGPPIPPYLCIRDLYAVHPIISRTPCSPILLNPEL